MTPIEELSESLSGRSRVIVIASREVDLRTLAGVNDLILLKMVEGSHAAGGRGAGFGERRVAGVSHFRYSEGTCEKLGEITDEAKAGEFEVPYYVTRLPLVAADGTDTMGYGVVDPDLVKEMVSRFQSDSSA